MLITTIVTQTPDGLFTWPYNTHDWVIVTLAFFGYLFRMYIWYKDKDETNPEARDWLGTFFITVILTVALYEGAIYKKLPIPMFFLPFAMVIVFAKDLMDWLFLSREGKRFLINSFKTVISGIFEKMGYVKKNNSEEDRN